jgi:hypothetical protein
MQDRLRYCFVSAALFLCLLSYSTTTVYSYVDPRLGVYAYQAMTACLTGVAFFLRRRWRAIFPRSVGRTGLEPAGAA